MKVINMHGIEWTELGNRVDEISYYDSEHEIFGMDKEGCTYKAVAMLSCLEIVDIDKDTIERVTG